MSGPKPPYTALGARSIMPYGTWAFRFRIGKPYWPMLRQRPPRCTPIRTWSLPGGMSIRSLKCKTWLKR